MNCERNNRCGCNQVGGAGDFPCREQLRALERCLRSIEEEEEETSRPCRCCRCCCCCCHRRGNSGAGNQTTWGR